MALQSRTERIRPWPAQCVQIWNGNVTHTTPTANVRENGCVRSAVRLLFAAVLWVLSGWRLLVQCAQIWYRRSHNYRSTSCPWGASRERRWRALPFFLLVTLARENDSSHFSLFSSLPLCNAIFRLHILRFQLSSRNWELYFSRLRAKEARSRRQFEMYEICYLRNNTFFSNTLEKICLK